MHNFDNVDNYLEHFGKKGMRWGKKSASNSSSEPKAEPKLKGRAKTKAIQQARMNTLIKAREAQLLEDSAVVAKNKKEFDYYKKAAEKKYKELANDTDYKLANKSTRGEKAVAALFLGTAAATLASTIYNATQS
jgi:hypothetical protein